MLAAIVCLEIPLTSLRGKFKLSQNRTAEDRSGVECLLGECPDPWSRALAHWMTRASVPPGSEPR
jgi:transcriptional regulator